MLASKYVMHALYQTVIAEWSDLNITYPEWLTRVVLDDVYYVIALVAICAACFAVGLAMGFIVTLV